MKLINVTSVHAYSDGCHTDLNCKPMGSHVMHF